MKHKSVLLFATLFTFFFIHAMPATTQGFDKAAFYTAMASGNMEQINDELTAIHAASFTEKEAYEGALLMRKAGVLKNPAEKLKAFKTGKIKLETALLNDADNPEYRFLRLIIQEHAPKIVKYNKELESDRLFIQKAYKNLSSPVQKAILDYSKTSKVLRQEDL